MRAFMAQKLKLRSRWLRIPLSLTSIAICAWVGLSLLITQQRHTIKVSTHSKSKKPDANPSSHEPQKSVENTFQHPGGPSQQKIRRALETRRKHARHSPTELDNPAMSAVYQAVNSTAAYGGVDEMNSISIGNITLPADSKPAVETPAETRQSENIILHPEMQGFEMQDEYSRTEVSPHLSVIGNFMPENVYHQEGGTCYIGSRIYIVGGFGTSREEAFKLEKEHGNITSKQTHVVDLETLQVRQLPDAIDRLNHPACAASPDGVIHVTGSFYDYIEDDGSLRRGASPLHWSYNTTDPKAEWKILENMPEGRGAHGCTFLADGDLYCVGGGSAQWGPFHPDLFIYTPKTGKWRRGPPMLIGRDHVGVLAIFNGKWLVAVGGRSDIMRRNHSLPHHLYWQTTTAVELYSLESNSWMRAANLPVPKASAQLVPYKRHADEDPNMLVIGGEAYIGASGVAFSSVEEFDIGRQTWHCHEPLSFPVYGGAAAVRNEKLYAFSGADWFGFATTRRMQIVNLTSAPLPEPCAYIPVRIKDAWERHHSKAQPWPGVRDGEDEAQHLRGVIASNYGFPTT